MTAAHRQSMCLSCCCTCGARAAHIKYFPERVGEGHEDSITMLHATFNLHRGTIVQATRSLCTMWQSRQLPVQDLCSG